MILFTFVTCDFTPRSFMKLVFFICIYTFVKPHNVQITKSTPKEPSFKFLQNIYRINFSEECYNVNGQVCTKGIRKMFRQPYEKYHPRVPVLYPILVGISSPTLSSKAWVKNIPFPSTIPSNIQYLKFIDYVNNNRRKKTNNLLLPKNVLKSNFKLNAPMYPSVHNTFKHSLDKSKTSSPLLSLLVASTEYNESLSVYQKNENYLIKTLAKSLEQFELLFYKVTFQKLLSISPASRQENGISFTQSALFLYLALMAISTEVDEYTKSEIENCLRYKASNMMKIKNLANITSWLPNSNNNLKFRWSSRLVLNSELPVSNRLVTAAARAGLRVQRLSGVETTEVIINTLNRMVEDDSGGALRNTFEEDDVVDEVCSVLLTTVYVRARWRSNPTLLNGTKPFYDANDLPQRSVRMIKINDIMQYASLDEWNADAIEINYATPGLTLLILVPRENSLKKLSKIMTNTTVHDVSKNMRTMRIAAILPMYTLRMTLLLPGKLEAMGITRLIGTKDSERCSGMRLSHAVQRLMFWVEAGQNAFKDDGIEWDETPELELVVNRPYIFYVRWKNVTLINGNFVL